MTMLRFVPMFARLSGYALAWSAYNKLYEIALPGSDEKEAYARLVISATLALTIAIADLVGVVFTRRSPSNPDKTRS